MSRIEEVLLRLTRRGLLGDYPLAGCTPAEIDEVARFAGQPLPDAYVQFLRLAGRDSDTITRGSDAYYPVLFRLREWAAECLAEAGCPYILPPDMFVFSMHQGYELCSFMLNQGADPPVLQFVHGVHDATGPTPQWDSFSSYIEELLSLPEAARF
jgi:hypothetical protein